MVTNADIFIAGAGPAGLAVAIFAANAGATVHVADARRPPLDKACGEGLMPEAIDLLAQLGIHFGNSDSHALNGIRFIGPKESAEALFPSCGIGICRTRLSEAMIARAESLGVRFHWQCVVSSLHNHQVQTSSGAVRSRWIVGADGNHSLVRRLAGLDACTIRSRRIGLRQHFHVAPWTNLVEVYWGPHSQAYITPVAPDKLCVAILARTRPASFEFELAQFPCLRDRLRSAYAIDAIVGSATVDLSLDSVTQSNIALVGDAAGAVDALTGQGVSLALQQAEALTRAFAADDLASYSCAHKELFRLPRFMSSALLLLERSPRLREQTLRAFSRHPELFASMLRVHTGERLPSLWGRNGILHLGARVLAA